MIVKSLLALALALASATPAIPQEYPPAPPPERYTDIPAILQVWCMHAAGTAFVAGGRVITAAHVTDNVGCSINGQFITATKAGDLDYAIIDAQADPGLRINCDGFKAGEHYWAIGYAKALPKQREIELVGTGEYDLGMALLQGWPTVIPGMSGGPIINARAEVVGIVNRYSPVQPYSWSVQLKDTSLCEGKQ